jgi:glycosyltransferase involved in cell wall biosynthesis
VGAARLISHLLFAFKATAYFRKNRDRYDVVYVTVPLNVLAWLVFMLAGTKTKIIDVVDIWPDVLPFPPPLRRLLAPAFGLWKWFFKSAVSMADLVMAVSDEFINEAATYANDSAKVKRFYIGHKRFEPSVTKQQVFTVAYVGNIGRLYDFDTLVDVLSDDDLRNTMQIFVIGKGDRQEWLVGELERRNIQHRFFGVLFESHRLGKILRSCHVGFNGYINTTAAFSYKAATYLAAGLPLVNSMTGDLQHLVLEHELGENYKGGNRQQLRDGLLRLYRNGTTTMAENCERFFASQVESSKIAADMKDFFASNIGGSCESSSLESGRARALGE